MNICTAFLIHNTKVLSHFEHLKVVPIFTQNIHYFRKNDLLDILNSWIIIQWAFEYDLSVVIQSLDDLSDKICLHVIHLHIFHFNTQVMSWKPDMSNEFFIQIICNCWVSIDDIVYQKYWLNGDEVIVVYMYWSYLWCCNIPYWIELSLCNYCLLMYFVFS